MIARNPITGYLGGSLLGPGTKTAGESAQLDQYGDILLPYGMKPQGSANGNGADSIAGAIGLDPALFDPDPAGAGTTLIVQKDGDVSVLSGGELKAIVDLTKMTIPAGAEGSIEKSIEEGNLAIVDNTKSGGGGGGHAGGGAAGAPSDAPQAAPAKKTPWLLYGALAIGGYLIFTRRKR